MLPRDALVCLALNGKPKVLASVVFRDAKFLAGTQEDEFRSKIGLCIHGTTHDEPTYVVDGVLHYGVTNMPGAVAHTSTFALTNATMPYAARIADHGVIEATRLEPSLRGGLNVAAGRVCHEAVAKSLGLKYEPVDF